MNKSQTYRNRAVRLIRNGRVKFHGLWYYPYDEKEPYHGEADGRWIVFYGYRNACQEHPIYHYIRPWGTWEFSQCHTEEEIDAYDHRADHDPFIGQFGRLRWQHWFPSKADVLTMLQSCQNREAMRMCAIDLHLVLFPELSPDEFWEVLDWNFRDLYPAYRLVHTHPENYAHVPELEWLQFAIMP